MWNLDDYIEDDTCDVYEYARQMYHEGVYTVGQTDIPRDDWGYLDFIEMMS